MSDVAAAQGYKAPPISGSKMLKLGPAPQLRVKSYCADCGTWDTHGPVCETCGYDFTGAFCPGAFRPFAGRDEDDQ